jgi:ferredoxin
MAVVIARRCPQNHTCPAVRLCPAGALSQKGWAAPVVDRELCTDCGLCALQCPYRALVEGPAASAVETR